MIVIDTDVLIEIFEKQSEKGDEALRKIAEAGEDIGITTITLHEVLYGIYKYAKEAQNILGLPVLEYTKADSVLSAALEFETEGRGRRVRRTDTMIAAITINNKGKLYTFDRDHFKDMQRNGLELFN